MLVGACDDLSIPRPLGPFRDFAARSRRALAGARDRRRLARDPDACSSPSSSGRRTRPCSCSRTSSGPTTRRSTRSRVLGRRIGSLPALLVLTFRPGEVPPGHPLHATVAAVAPEDSVFLELEPLSETRGRLAGRRRGRTRCTRPPAGNPFYVTELVGCAVGGGLPPTVTTAVRGRASRLDERHATWSSWSRSVPGRVADPDARCGDAELERGGGGARAAPAARGRAAVTCASGTSWRGTRSRRASRRPRGGACTRRSSPSCSRPTPTRRTSSTTPRPPGAEDVVAEYALVAARRAAALESNREAFSHYRRAADFVDRLAGGRAGAACSRSSRRRPTSSVAPRRAFAAIDAGDRGLSRARRRHGRRPLRADPVPPALDRGRRSDGPEGARGDCDPRAARPVGGARARLQHGLAARDARGGHRRDAPLGETRASSRPSWVTSNARARARQHRRRRGSTRRRPRRCSRRTPSPRRRTRHEAARALDNLGYSLLGWVRPKESLRYAEQATAYGRARAATSSPSYAGVVVAWLRLRAGAWDEAERGARREIESGVVVRLLAKTVLAELAVRRGDPDAAERLAEVGDEADRTGEPQRIVPVARARRSSGR